MRCSVCGHESPPGSSFCLNCGSSLASAIAQTPAAGGGLPVMCAVCRNENPPGMKFCRSCGAALTQTGQGHAMPGAGMGGAPMMAPMAPAPMAPPPMNVSTAGGGLGKAAPPAPQRVPMGSTITCPRCNTSTPVGFAYCQQCGLHIQAVAPTDPGAIHSAGARVRTPTPAQPSLASKPGVDPQGATLAAPEGSARAALLSPFASPQAGAASAPRVAGGPAWGTAVLVNRDGSDGQRFSLTAEDTLIGRAGADIAFDDDRFLAKQHARLARSAAGEVTIHPIDTLNGVFKKAAEPVELVDGGTLLVGREVLRFERVGNEERTIHPLVRHGVALFGSPPREPWGRLLQLIPSGGYRDVRHLVSEEVVLGREEGDVVFRDDAFMSRRHAAITWDGRVAKVTDLGSSNGTFVRIAGPTPLKNGDHVRMGDQLLRIEISR